MINKNEKYSMSWIHDSLYIKYDGKTYNLGSTLWWTLDSMILRYNNFLKANNLESSKDYLLIIADSYRDLPKTTSYIEQTEKGIKLTHEKHAIEVGFNKTFVYSIKGIVNKSMDIVKESLGNLIEPILRDIKVPMELSVIFMYSVNLILKQPEVKPSVIKIIKGKTFVFYVETGDICYMEGQESIYLTNIRNSIAVSVKEIRDMTYSWEDKPDLSEIDDLVVSCVEYKRSVL